MALENGRIVATGTDIVKVTYRLARSMRKKDTQMVRAKCGGNIEVSHINGGQPVYYYMLSVE